MTQQPVIIEDTYTGDVTPGGPAQRRRIPGASIVKLAVGEMNNNTYLVTDDATGKSVFIDAANEPDRLVQFLRDNAPELELIVTTHQHWDHWQGLERVAAETGVPTAAHELDADPLPVTPDRILAEGDTVQIGELNLEVIHLSGHTPGSVALVLTERGTGRTHIFTGDSLFPGGLGRTTKPEEFDSLYQDVTTKIFDRFDDETIFYPGHGKDSTLGAERPHLGEWRERRW
ncbi:Zn-dependent hydrolase [Rhodococcus pyridinivorans SB3094]|uniref:Zn-dependent hydrolase n=1 Tax=Rhodococcus pyridinivorans SB3094 TaxID=1435356 RepID=V9XDG5_9NOCA|nr:MBL fold metallo-hydrolase [Rhodococcus pyridinivorans]AHD20040.1 Zn-dependent hydrolase [Rhodococcus pyridinivorans SB3094]